MHFLMEIVSKKRTKRRQGKRNEDKNFQNNDSFCWYVPFCVSVCVFV